MPVPQRHQAEPQHRPGEKCLELQGRLRRRRRRDRVGEAGRRRQLQPRAGVAETRLSSVRHYERNPAAENLHGAQTAATVSDERGRSKTAGCCGRLLSRNTEADAGSAAVSPQARPAIGGDAGALPVGLFQPLAELPSAGQEPRRGCPPTRAFGGAGHLSGEERA